MFTIIGLNFLLVWLKVSSAEEAKATTTPSNIDAALDTKFGTDLVSQLRNDANLDLPPDEEYEDLRAELLAYHSALAKLADETDEPKPGRRSMMTTECWKLGGICVNRRLCVGFRSLTEVPGCKDKLNVCCFTWNKYRVKDMREFGIPGPYPWSIQHPYGPPEDRDTRVKESTTQKRPKGKKKKKPKSDNIIEKFKANYDPQKMSTENNLKSEEENDDDPINSENTPPKTQKYRADDELEEEEEETEIISN